MKRNRLIAWALACLLLCRPMAVLAADVPGEAGAETAPQTQEPVDTEESQDRDAIHESDDMAEPEGGPSALGLDATRALTRSDALELDGAALLLYERTTGTLVYAKNIDTRREPASVTKLMTCLLALEYGGLTDEILVTEKALETMDPDGSSAELRPGETYSLEQLLYCLMVASANDAALVIADYLGGSQAGFVEMMNQWAQELGCTGTHFENPHGLHGEEHYTTARDLAKLFQAALEYDLFWSLFSTTEYEVSPLRVEPEYDEETGEYVEVEPSAQTLYSTDYLISTAINDEYYDPRVVGGKTGFTTPAGRCVVCLAEQDGLSYLAVVLGASAEDQEGEPIYGSFLTASALFDVGFDGCAVSSAIPADAAVSIPVSHGVTPATAAVEAEVGALLPVSYDPALLTTDCELYAPLTAPIEDGTGLGIMAVYFDGVRVGETALYAAGQVEYTDVPPAKRGLPAGRFPSPLPDSRDRLPFRL